MNVLYLQVVETNRSKSSLEEKLKAAMIEITQLKEATKSQQQSKVGMRVWM